MRYRAELITGDKLERPQVCFANYLDNLDDWMKRQLREHPDGRIEIYEFKITLVRRVSARISDDGDLVLNCKSILNKG